MPVWLSVVGIIAILVVLEGLLSADNALVLAVMVRHLPPNQQRRALRYGIWGAFLFRFIAVILASQILDYWQFEVVGGLYLLYLAIKNLVFGEPEDDPSRRDRAGRSFWATVIGVELTDIAFSIDSILAAVGAADGLPRELHNVMDPLGIFSVKSWVIYIGGVLGIIMMRFVAGFFITLLDRFKGLAAGAYFLVGWIGVKLVGSGLHHALYRKGERLHGPWRDAVPEWLADRLEMTTWIFWGGMVAIVLISLLYKPRETNEPRPGPGL